MVTINNDARTEIKIHDESKQGALISIPNLPVGDISGVTISDSEKLMCFYVKAVRNLPRFVLYNFETSEVKQLTNTMSKEIDSNDLVAGEVVRVKSFDGLEIPCLLYKPKGIRSGEKVPALLWIHGGLVVRHGLTTRLPCNFWLTMDMRYWPLTTGVARAMERVSSLRMIAKAWQRRLAGLCDV